MTLELEMADNKDETGRVLFFEFDGLTRIVRDCHDVDEIEQQAGFTQCPICGGKRANMSDGNGTYLDHDDNYGAYLN